MGTSTTQSLGARLLDARGSASPLLIGAGATLLLGAGLGAWLLTRPPRHEPTPSPTSVTSPPGAEPLDPQPTSAPVATTPTSPPAANPTTDIRLGQLNVQNLFDPVDAPRVQDDVPTSAEYARHLRKLALTLRDTMGAPDAVTLEEVENERVLDDLVARPELAGLGYRPIIREGRDPRGIDVAILYRRDRLTPASVTTWDPYGESPSGRRTRTFTRPPLAVTFTQPDGTAPVTLAAVHLTSRVQGADGERRRAQQTDALAHAVAGARGVAPVVLSGDFNMTTDEAPFQGLVHAEAWDGVHLLEPLDAIPAEERYSYRQGRTRELLDHVLVSEGTEAGDARIPHTNTSATAPQRRDPDTPAGASDHDPVVVRIAPG